MIGDLEHVLPSSKRLILLLSTRWLLLFGTTTAYFATYYFAYDRRKFKPMAWTARTHKNLLRLPYPVYNEIIRLSHSVHAFLNVFNPYQILPKVFKSLLTKLLIVVFRTIFYCIWIFMLMTSMFGKLNPKFLRIIPRNAIENFSILLLMHERGIFTHCKIEFMLELKKWDELLDRSEQISDLWTHLLYPFSTC